MARQHQPRDPGQAVAYDVPDGYTLFVSNNAILATNAALPAKTLMSFKSQIGKLAKTNICRAPKPLDFDSESAAR